LPAAAGDEHERKQNPEMRLVCQQAQEAAGQHGSPLHQAERAAEQRGAEESVLTDHEVREHRRKRAGEQNADALADDHADGGHVGGKRQQRPEHLRRGQRQRCGERGHEQERRRIEPSVVAVERVADAGIFDRLVDRLVVGGRGASLQHETAGGPDVDEIGRDEAAFAVEQPEAQHQ
jgi:hypothetical protein